MGRQEIKNSTTKDAKITKVKFFDMQSVFSAETQSTQGRAAGRPWFPAALSALRGESSGFRDAA